MDMIENLALRYGVSVETAAVFIADRISDRIRLYEGLANENLDKSTKDMIMGSIMCGLMGKDVSGWLE